MCCRPHESRVCRTRTACRMVHRQTTRRSARNARRIGRAVVESAPRLVRRRPGDQRHRRNRAVSGGRGAPPQRQRDPKRNRPRRSRGRSRARRQAHHGRASRRAHDRRDRRRGTRPPIRDSSATGYPGCSSAGASGTSETSSRSGARYLRSDSVSDRCRCPPRRSRERRRRTVSPITCSTSACGEMVPSGSEQCARFDLAARRLARGCGMVLGNHPG